MESRIKYTTEITHHNREQFGRRVRELRKDKDWLIKDLATATSLHRNYISSVELGERNISLDNIIKIAKALEVNVGQLFIYVKGV